MLSSQWPIRFAVALGGFLIFVGIMMIGLFIAIYFDLVDAGVLENEKYRMLSLWALFAVGLLDLVSGLILRRR